MRNGRGTQDAAADAIRSTHRKERHVNMIISRRQALLGLGASGLAIVSIGPLSKLSHADAAGVDNALKGLIGDKSVGDGSSIITMDLPQIAENGNTVPLTVAVDSPMSDAENVKSVHIFAEGNPLPDVASFHFTPQCGVAQASTRMRLAGTQNVVAVAELSDGTVVAAKTEVKVTIGGCGG